MKLVLAKVTVLFATIIQLTALTYPAAAELKAGSSRVDITPALVDLPQPFTVINSQLYARALVLEDAGKRVAIVVADGPTTDPDIFDDLFKRIASAAGTTPENVIFSVTHMHSGVRLANDGMGILFPGSTKLTKITEDRIADCVKQAVANLQPARAGFGTGTFHLATLRVQSPGQSSGESQKPAEPAALLVFKVESLTGDPIALLVNGGPEPVMNMSKTAISADVAGVTERYIEERFNDKTVALYTVGLPSQLIVNSRQRIQGASPADPNALMNAVGTILGEEALSASMRVKTSPELQLSGAVQVLTCPGKATTPLNNASSCSDAPDSKLPRCVFTDRDTGPVDLRMGVIRLGELSIVTSDANVGPVVWKEVMDRAPSPANTMLLALTYGPVHYVVPDAEYPTNSYQATATMVKRGCAEKGFVDGVLSLLKSGAKSN